jgi:hypothetical protein
MGLWFSLMMSLWKCFGCFKNQLGFSFGDFLPKDNIKNACVKNVKEKKFKKTNCPKHPFHNNTPAPKGQSSSIINKNYMSTSSFPT